jgi:hypothetical protein
MNSVLALLGNLPHHSLEFDSESHQTIVYVKDGAFLFRDHLERIRRDRDAQTSYLEGVISYERVCTDPAIDIFGNSKG